MNIHADDTYQTGSLREDANGAQWLYAFAHGDLTAQTIYPMYPALCDSSYGYKTMALFDTATASLGASCHQKYRLGIPEEAISSGTWGWLQTRGYVASVNIDSLGVSITAGALWRWKDATAALGGAGVSASGFVADFAVNITTGSATTADMFLMGNPVCGIT